LNLACAADGFVHVTQAEGAIVETVDLIRSAASGEQDRCARLGVRKAVVILILRDVVDGHVEAGCIGDIENVEAEFQFVRSVMLVFLRRKRPCASARTGGKCYVVRW